MDPTHVDPKQIVAVGYDRIAEQYGAWASQARQVRPRGVLVATTRPQGAAATYADDWLGAPIYWSGVDRATTTQQIAAAGLHLLRAEEETFEEFGVPITFLWVIAEKPV